MRFFGGYDIDIRSLQEMLPLTLERASEVVHRSNHPELPIVVCLWCVFFSFNLELLAEFREPSEP